MILEKARSVITHSKSKLGFETQAGGSWEAWDRYLTIDGKKAFHIGNICNTCSFFFERMSGANQSISPEGLVNDLNNGITTLKPNIVQPLETIFPDGEYHILLKEITPDLCAPLDTKDYFSHEQIDLWGSDGFWGRPHDPKTEYYRLATKKLSQGRGLFEFLVPIFPHTWLKEKRVAEYRQLLNNNQKPTLIALSILDVKQPADWEGDQDITSHWCLTHYLIDGHHKTYAAASENKPVTMISFLSIDKGISSKEEIERLLEETEK